jgi:hypothetical protein
LLVTPAGLAALVDAPVVPPALTPPVAVTAPAWLPPPDGELFPELQPTSEKAATANALAKIRERECFMVEKPPRRRDG